MKSEILNCLTFIANAAAEQNVFAEYWSKEFRCKNTDDALDRVYVELYKHLDWDNLTDSECDELRFGKWEKGNPLRLIPIWLYRATPNGTKLTSISGEEVVFERDKFKDTDIRFGCLAYGIIPKDKRENENS